MSAKLKLNCKQCNCIFYRYKIRIRGGFCSKNCWSKYQSVNGRIKTLCAVCSIELERIKSKTKRMKHFYCSQKCESEGKSLFYKGTNSFNWQGGKTLESRRVRHSLEYRLWREAVFKRDDYTCQLCGDRGGNLQADHIKAFAYYPELRFAIDNGRTLCLECHKQTDTYLYKGIRPKNICNPTKNLLN